MVWIVEFFFLYGTLNGVPQIILFERSLNRDVFVYFVIYMNNVMYTICDKKQLIEHEG